MKGLRWPWAACAAWQALSAWAAAPDALPAFDFTRPADRGGWRPLHHIRSLTASDAGWVVVVDGEDPFMEGPPRDFPPGQPLWMHVRMRSDASGMAQVFYFDKGASEDRSIRFHIRGGAWREARLPLPPLGPGTRLRFDPPGSSGTCVVASVRFEPRPVLQEPNWNPPSGVAWKAKGTLRSGDLELAHGGGLGQFELRIAGEPMATGHDRAQIGHVVAGKVQWTPLSGPASVTRRRGELRVKGRVAEPEGGHWEVEHVFRASSTAGALDFEARLGTTRDRDVVHAPMLLLLPGAGPGGFGAHKAQGLMAGVEYLDDEPSSSTAAVAGPGARRSVPDPMKLTFPLMVISARGRCLGLEWEPGPAVAALHDSPDRVFRSGGHVMGLLVPGARPEAREDGSLLPYGPVRILAGKPWVVRGTILGSRGNTVLPAVQAYVGRHPLPGLPRVPGMDLGEYARLVAMGWLRSEIRDGARFRHAVGTGFGSAPAADAALGLRWVAGALKDQAMAAEAAALARAAEAEVPRHRLHATVLGHVRHPAEAPLVMGSIAENVADAVREGRGIVAQFDAGGGLPYRAPEGVLDLGRTHGSSEANGLAGAAVVRLMELAAFTGDGGLREEGMRLLRALRRFRDTVPRGAQTWEVPLNAPDILASAHMTRAWTLGYELTGDEACLGEARSWAWTGVPFVYLTPPTSEPVGVYGTIPVLGATHYVAPLWIGLPVQWCGLVYADAVRRLARHDPGGPWDRLADGIAWAGIQHTLSSESPRHAGLLPDSFDLRAQVPLPVPINPATLFPEALRTLGGPWLYDLHRVRATGWVIQAPGRVHVTHERKGSATMRVETWPSGEWWMLVDGLASRPVVRVDGREALGAEVEAWDAAKGRLTLRLQGRPTVEVSCGRQPGDR